MKPINHDRFLRNVFSTPAHAAAMLVKFLGRQFALDHDLSTLELVPGNFVDSGHRRHEVDFLFKVKKSGGKSVYIYVLVEHQSTPFAMMPVRLFRYVSRIFEASDAENRSPRDVPEVIPVVLYNGHRKWNSPTKLSDFYDRENPMGSLEDAAVELKYRLVDLSKVSDQQIRLEGPANTHTTILALLFLKHIYDEYFGALLKEWAYYFHQAYREIQGESFLKSATYYILESTDLAYEELIDCVVPYTEPEVETLIKTTGQKLREEGRIQGRAEGHMEGRKEGRAEGRQEGLQEATAKALRIVLISRFSELTDEQNRKIDGANLDQLTNYLERVSGAKTVDEALG